MKIEERKGELVVVDFDECEAYRISCKIERDGIHFYRRLAQAVGNPEVSDMLEFLAQEEKKHLAFFEDALTAIREEKDDLSEDDDLIASMEFGVFQPYQSAAQLEDVLSDTGRALRLGVAIEDSSIRFYRACQREISAPETKKGIAAIVEEEKRHRELLENIAKNLPDAPQKKMRRLP